MKNVFGFQIYKGNRDDKKYFNHYVLEDGEILNIKGFDHFTYISSNKFTNIKDSKEGFYILYTPQKKELKILKQGKLIYSRNIEDLAMKLHKEYGERNQIKMNEMVVTEQNEKVKVLYVFKHIHGFEDRTIDKVSVDSLGFYIFTKLYKD